MAVSLTLLMQKQKIIQQLSAGGQLEPFMAATLSPVVLLISIGESSAAVKLTETFMVDTPRLILLIKIRSLSAARQILILQME